MTTIKNQSNFISWKYARKAKTRNNEHYKTMRKKLQKPKHEKDGKIRINNGKTFNFFFFFNDV